MEYSRPPFEKKSPDNEHFTEFTESISNFFVSKAQEKLSEDPELQKAVVDFYSDIKRLQAEMKNVFKKDERVYINEQLSHLENEFQKEDSFKQFCEEKIEAFQTTNVREQTLVNSKEREFAKPEADNFEYKLGYYRESLEEQLADAVFALAKKKYFPFESGMTELHENRIQYINFYNQDIEIPKNLVSRLEEKGFKISLEQMNDSSEIQLEPTVLTPVRMSSWKEAWNTVAQDLPARTAESIQNPKEFASRKVFRDYQDILLRGQKS